MPPADEVPWLLTTVVQPQHTAAQPPISSHPAAASRPGSQERRHPPEDRVHGRGAKGTMGSAAGSPISAMSAAAPDPTCRTAPLVLPAHSLPLPLSPFRQSTTHRECDVLHIRAGHARVAHADGGHLVHHTSVACKWGVEGCSEAGQSGQWRRWGSLPQPHRCSLKTHNSGEGEGAMQVDARPAGASKGGQLFH